MSEILWNTEKSELLISWKYIKDKEYEDKKL